MLSPGDVVSYLEMCAGFGVNLQRGMNFRLRGDESLILMSLRDGAPYADRIEDRGRVIIYEGHDIPRARGGPDPKDIDQPEFQPSGRLTQNGLFLDAGPAATSWAGRKRNESESTRKYEMEYGSTTDSSS